MAHCDTIMSGSPIEVIAIMANQDPSGEAEFRVKPINTGAMDKWLGVMQGTTRVAKARWLTDWKWNESVFAALVDRTHGYQQRWCNLLHDRTLAEPGQSEITASLMYSQCLLVFQIGEEVIELGQHFCPTMDRLHTGPL